MSENEIVEALNDRYFIDGERLIVNHPRTKEIVAIPMSDVISILIRQQTEIERLRRYEERWRSLIKVSDNG